MENNKPVNQFKDFEKGKQLRYWDNNKVLLSVFTPKGQTNEIRFFRGKPENWNQILSMSNLTEQVNEEKISEFIKPTGNKLEGFDIHNEVGKYLDKIPSRSVMAEIREPFIIEPWNQCLIDEAVKYGSMIDEDKEDYLFERKDGESILLETKLSLANLIQNTNLIWASRSQMVCHPDSVVYGEIDEIWFDKVDNKFYIGDTKTSSSIDKIGYWYQLGVYIEIIKSLNPHLKESISSEAIIQWIKIQNDKWSIRDDFNSKDINNEYINLGKKYEYSKWILDNAQGKKPETIEKAKRNVEQIERDIISKYQGRGNEAKPNDSIYWSKWNSIKTPLTEEEQKDKHKNLLVKRDLEKEGVLELVRRDIAFFGKYNISTSIQFDELIATNEEAKKENELLQYKYDELKKAYENGSKGSYIELKKH